jgi:N-acetylmuramoyl-L-alanine amidase CwlA
MSYLISQQYIKKNRPGLSLLSEGVVIHETANPGATDEMHRDYFDKNDVKASAHAFVDWDSITNTIPWNEISWHAGRTANFKYWGIEMCNTPDPLKFNEVWKRSVWLVAHLFRNVSKPAIFVVTPQNLRAHAETSAQWGETNHTDPIDYFAKFGKTMADFRNDVQKKIDEMGQMKMNWEEIIKKVSTSPDTWIKAIKTAVAVSKADGSLGDLETLQWLPDLIEKVYHSQK